MRECMNVRKVRTTPDEESRIVIQYPKGIHVLRKLEETIWKYEGEEIVEYGIADSYYVSVATPEKADYTFLFYWKNIIS